MKLFLFFLALLFGVNLYSQSFDEDKTSLTNFVTRMYKAKPFEGVKIVEDYDNKYLLSVLSLENGKYPNESVQTRIATVKAQSQTSTFLNGSNIQMDMIMTTNETETSDGVKETTVQMIEKIKENASGFVKQMEQLANFDINDSERKLFVFYKKLEQE